MFEINTMISTVVVSYTPFDRLFYFVGQLIEAEWCTCVSVNCFSIHLENGLSQLHFGKRNHKIFSAENRIRFHLRVVINTTDCSVLGKISTHSYKGFALLMKRITICIEHIYIYHMYIIYIRCNLRNSYVCYTLDCVYEMCTSRTYEGCTINSVFTYYILLNLWGQFQSFSCISHIPLGCYVCVVLCSTFVI